MNIFISYAHENYDAAKKLFTCLQSQKTITPWLDKECLLPGSDWEMEINKAIEESDFVIVLLSRDSVSKEGYFQKEVRKVLERLEHFPPGKIFVIPARLEPCSPLHPVIKKLHWVDLFDDWINGVDKIKSVLYHGHPKLLFPVGITHVIGSEKQFLELFPEGQQLPCMHSDIYTTSEDNQEEIEVILSHMQGEEIVKIVSAISDVPAKKQGEAQITVSISIDDKRKIMIETISIDDGRKHKYGPYDLS